MEEAKAASYYEEMMRKGEGAAKFKQGLGYSTNSQETFSKGSILSSMSNFVKASSPGKSEGIEKKAHIESIREKLRKKDQYLSESRRGRDEKEVQYSSHSLDKRKDNSCDRHSDLSKRDSERLRNSSDKHRRYRSRSRERRHWSKSRERKSHRSSSRSRRHRSSSRDRTGSRDRRCRSSSRDRRQRQNSRDRRHRSTSREKREDRKRSKNSSCDREKEHGHYKRKYQSTSSSSSQLYGRDSPRRRRGRSISPSRSEDEGHSRRRSRSPGFLNEDDIRRKRNSSPRKQCTNPSEKIPGFDAMTVAEKLKAKMRSQLSQAEVKESSKGTDERWERFDFNKDAPLDDDSIFDHSEEHTGYKDDTTFLKNAGTTFSSSISQAKREANIQAAHEAAIFGLPVNSNVSNIPCHKDDYKLQDKPIDEIEMECESIVDNSGSRGNVIGNNVINEQVFTMQQGSWRDRARKLREQKEAAPNY